MSLKFKNTVISRLSLQVKIISVIGLLCFTVIVMTAISAVSYFTDDKTTAIQLRAEQAVRLQADILATALWDIDAESEAAILEAFKGDADFLYVEIKPSDGSKTRSVGTPPKLSETNITTITQTISYDDGGRVSELGELTLVLSHVSLESSISTITTFGTIIAIVMITVLLGGVMVAIRMFTKPIGKLTGVMESLAHGDLSTEVPYHDRTDEIGSIATAVAVFKQNAIENERLQKEAEGVRTQQAEEEQRLAQEQQEREKQRREEQTQREEQDRQEKHQAMLDLANMFQQRVGGILESVSDAANELNSTAKEMSVAAKATSNDASESSQAISGAESNVQVVASAAEELSASISEISRQARKATDSAQQAVKVAGKTSDDMDALDGAAKRINDVVHLINDIAEQTNLLALNATIEAARAGDAGKGFAVVASEVKSLANQTAKATDDIIQQINDIQQASSNAVSAVVSIRENIDELYGIATNIASSVEEQSAATQEISQNAQYASSSTSQVSANIANVTAVAEKTGNAASHLLSASQKLAQQTGELQTEMDQFLNDIRSA